MQILIIPKSDLETIRNDWGGCDQIEIWAQGQVRDLIRNAAYGDVPQIPCRGVRPKGEILTRISTDKPLEDIVTEVLAGIDADPGWRKAVGEWLVDTLPVWLPRAIQYNYRYWYADEPEPKPEHQVTPEDLMRLPLAERERLTRGMPYQVRRDLGIDDNREDDRR